MINKEDYYKIGDIRKTHGVKGEMMLINDVPIDEKAIETWLFFNLDECLIPFEVNSTRATTDKTLLFQCKEITSIEEAEGYVDTEIYLPLSTKKDEENLENPFSLIGLEVIDDETEEKFGTVSNFIESHHNPLLEIEGQNDTFLLPFNEAFILGIEDNKLFVTLPEGLLDL